MLSIPDKIKPTFIDKNKLITVKLHLQGVLKNENTETLSIGATNYLVRKKGQFIYGKQNLFNGAFGIIPNFIRGQCNFGWRHQYFTTTIKYKPNLFILYFKFGKEKNY